MGIEYIIILLVTGIVVGFAAGLIGLGGGFLMIPVQYMVYSSMGFSTDIAVKMSFGTTLLVVLPTAAGGTWVHLKKGAVWWRAALFMGSITFFGSMLGATLASNLPGVALRIAFGAIALAASIRMVTARLPATNQEPRQNLWLWAAISAPVGVLTGILGIGGGILVIPIMVLVLRFHLHLAIATSLATMLFTSAGGAIGYIINGLNVPGLPPYTLGYVNLISWGLLTAGSLGFVRVGALAAHRTSARKLNYIFSAVIFVMGLKMLGFFSLLGLPF